MARRGRLHQNIRLSGGDDRRFGRILNRNRLAAGGKEGGDEVVDAGIGAGEGVVCRQDRLRVTASEGHAIRKIGSRVDRIAIAVLGGDPEASGHPRGGLVGEAGDRQFERRRRVDSNRRSAGNAAAHGIRSRDRLAAGGLECGRESMNAGIAAGKRVIHRQDRLGIAAAEHHGPPVAHGGIIESIQGGDREGETSSRSGSSRSGDTEVGCESDVAEDRPADIHAAHRGDRISGRHAGLHPAGLHFFLDRERARTDADKGKIAAGIGRPPRRARAFHKINGPTFQAWLAPSLHAVAVDIVEHLAADSHGLEVAEGLSACIHATVGGHRVRGLRARSQPTRFEFLLNGESARTEVAKAKVATGVGEDLLDESAAFHQIGYPVLQARLARFLDTVAVQVIEDRAADGHGLEIEEVYAARILAIHYGGRDARRRGGDPTAGQFFDDGIVACRQIGKGVFTVQTVKTGSRDSTFQEIVAGIKQVNGGPVEARVGFVQAVAVEVVQDSAADRAASDRQGSYLETGNPCAPIGDHSGRVGFDGILVDCPERGRVCRIDADAAEVAGAER